MSYAPTTDFLGLLRQTSSGAELARMPGLDFVTSALGRMGMFRLWVGQSAPSVNQTTTAWLVPALPSWTAEGVVFLWNTDTAAYELATPALWTRLLLAPSSTYVFQSVKLAAGVVGGTTALLAVQRANPAATALTLPALATRGGTPLQVVDWSSGIVQHVMTLSTPDGATIMQRPSWSVYSTPDQFAGITLYPSPDLNGWVIAP